MSYGSVGVTVRVRFQVTVRDKVADKVRVRSLIGLRDAQARGGVGPGASRVRVRDRVRDRVRPRVRLGLRLG